MTLHYYPETDSLYIELRSGPGAETVEIRNGLVVDIDAEGRVVGLDMDQASRRFDLSRMELVSLPLSQNSRGSRSPAPTEEEGGKPSTRIQTVPHPTGE